MAYNNNISIGLIIMKIRCKICNKEFITTKYLLSIGKGKFCSRNCYYNSKLGKRRNLVKLKCKECGGVFYRNKCIVEREPTKYCSMKCLGKANSKRLKGDGHWNWKGGKSPRVLNSVEYNHWRKEVFKRDNYICRSCGYTGGRILEAHHIKSWKKYPKLRFKVSNGLTLCKICHTEIHKRSNNKDFNNPI